MDQADTADDRRLRPKIHCLPAYVNVSVVECLEDLGDGEAVLNQLVFVDGDLVGLGLAGPTADVHHTRNGLEAALKNPILDGLQVHDRVAGRPDNTIAVGHVIGELYPDIGQAEQGDGPHGADVRDAGHLNLDRNGEITLYLFGRLAGTLGDKLDAWRHWIGIGFDVEVHKTDNARTEEKHHYDDHEHPLLQCKCDDAVQLRFVLSEILFSPLIRSVSRS